MESYANDWKRNMRNLLATNALAAIFLIRLMVGPGPWSLDAYWTRNRQP